MAIALAAALAVGLPKCAMAQVPEVTQAQQALVRAAHEDAVARLLEQIEAEPVAPDLMAREVLAALGPEARQAMRTFLRESPQVGGPRFPGPLAAQVQLQASGEDVATEIARLAEARPGVTLPQNLRLSQLRALLSTWSDRTFAASGRSISAELAEQTLPDLAFDGNSDGRSLAGDGTDDALPAANRLWRERGDVSEAERQRAFADARRDAVEQVMTAARPVVIVPPANEEERGVTLGDAFDLDPVGERSRRWLASQPITRIVYDDDRRIEVRMSIEPASWLESIRGSLQNVASDADPSASTQLVGASDRQWSDAVAELRRALPEEPRGSAFANVSAELPETAPSDESTPLAEALRPLIRPADAASVAPQWSTRRIDAEGSSEATATSATSASRRESRGRLQAAREAETAARQSLRDTLLALPLAGTSTVGSVAQQDPAAAAVVTETIESAEVVAAIYAADRTARVRVAVEGEALWESLLAAADLAAVE